VAVNEVARVYAGALLEIGKEKNILQKVEEELAVLSTLIAEDGDFRSFCETPNISAESKKDFIEKVFKENEAEHRRVRIQRRMRCDERNECAYDDPSERSDQRFRIVCFAQEGNARFFYHRLKKVH
jgi:ABC-type proline/glycine betaine transport system ATPase subunit